MSKGKLLQAAPPQDVYRAPADATVGGFIGRGSIVSAVATGYANGATTVEIAGHRVAARSAGGQPGPVKVLLRPEALRLSSEGMPATVLDSIYRGPVYEVRLALPEPGQELLIDSVEALAAGQKVRVAVSDGWIIPGG